MTKRFCVEKFSVNFSTAHTKKVGTAYVLHYKGEYVGSSNLSTLREWARAIWKNRYKVNVTKCYLNLNEQWDITPEVVMEVESLPKNFINSFVYEERDGCYRAEMPNGFAYFMHWRGPGNAGGSGGRHVYVSMTDGSIRTLKGPWSSNSMSVNEFFPDREPLIEVTVVDTDEYYSRYGYAATVEFCCKQLGIEKMNYEEFMVYLNDCKKKAAWKQIKDYAVDGNNLAA